MTEREFDPQADAAACYELDCRRETIVQMLYVEVIRDV